MDIQKTKLEFSTQQNGGERSKHQRKNPNCSICHRPIWHEETKGRMANVCGVSCELSRRILGGGRSIEETWDLMSRNKICDWVTIEEWWRDMGHLHFPGAYLIRRSRGAKHSKQNSIWVAYAHAKRIDVEIMMEKKGRRELANGKRIGDVAKSYGINILLFQRMCGGIAKRYGLSLDQVYLEYSMAPPPSEKWADEITVQHQGQEYSIRRISKECGMSLLSIYWRWMHGMYLIDDQMSYRLSRIRTRPDARARQLQRFQEYQQWQG